MPRILSILRILTATSVMMISLLLCWQCIDVYTDGQTSPEAGTESGIYTQHDVASRLYSLRIPFAIGGGVIFISALIHSASGANWEHSAKRGASVTQQGVCCSKQKTASAPLRLLLYILTFAFILLGMMNGGLHDVLVKAINICTECIGLG